MLQDETLTVHHFHFTFWADKTPPQYAFPLLTFRQRIKAHDDIASGPLIVHCRLVLVLVVVLVLVLVLVLV